EDPETVLGLFDDAQERKEITEVMAVNKDERLPRLTPGELTSDASAQRRRNHQVLDSRQHMGHKADGIVLVSKRPVELCWTEAAKKDGGANTTKCLHDTKKLLKLMKDGHDRIRKRAKQNIRDQLVTFALRISGPTISVFTLRQCPGRFYKVTEEELTSLPLKWMDNEDTTQILAVIARILKLRKAIQKMAVSVNTWTQSTIDNESPCAKDWMAPTMTSPQFLPVKLPSPDATIPALAI
ncbi:hypothetical protein BGZ70_009302, partial [Mortierella alpina]